MHVTWLLCTVLLLPVDVCLCVCVRAFRFHYLHLKSDFSQQVLNFLSFPSLFLQLEGVRAVRVFYLCWFVHVCFKQYVYHNNILSFLLLPPLNKKKRSTRLRIIMNFISCFSLHFWKRALPSISPDGGNNLPHLLYALTIYSISIYTSYVCIYMYIYIYTYIYIYIYIYIYT